MSLTAPDFQSYAGPGDRVSTAPSVTPQTHATCSNTIH